MVDLKTIAKDLKCKFEAYQRNSRDWKDADKRQVKEEILTIGRLHEWSECEEADDTIEVLLKNILNISFSLKDPRVPS